MKVVTESDLTGWGPYLMVFCLVLLIFGIVCIFWRDPIVQLIYSCLSALLFSVYLVFDTQLVLGKGEYSYTLDDAYLAAIQLYIDIMELFLHILRILSYFSDNWFKIKIWCDLFDTYHFILNLFCLKNRNKKIIEKIINSKLSSL